MFSVHTTALLATCFDVSLTPSSDRNSNSVYIQRTALIVRRTLSCVALHSGLSYVYTPLLVKIHVKKHLKHSSTSRCSVLNVHRISVLL
jgi:hypothetical protein